MRELITSLSNPKIKRLLELQQKSSERRESGIFVVEGTRELSFCIKEGFEIDTLFVCPEIAKSEEWQLDKVRTYEVSGEVYAKIAYREGTEGVIAEVKQRFLSLQDLKLPPSPLIAVIEGVEKPGNIGAILRTCDAAKVDALFICDPKTDLYNPNLIRASLGAVFTVPCVCLSSAQAIDFLRANDIQILTAQLQDSAEYYNTPMTSGTAIVVGTESTGLTDAWRKVATKHIRIPMRGLLDSLNVSVSAAILLFEANRQRNG